MGFRRRQPAQSLDLNLGVNRGQRAEDGYTQIDVAGAARAGGREPLDLNPAFEALKQAAHQRRLQREREAQAAGLEAAQRGDVQRLVEETAAEAGEGGTLEEREKRNQAAFAKLVARGEIAEADDPWFRVGLEQGTARRLADRAKGRLMAEVQRFGQLTDENGDPVEPPDADAIINQIFDEEASSGAFALQSPRAQEAYVQAREGIEAEFRTRVAQARTEALTVEGRRVALNDMVSGTETEAGIQTLAEAEEVTPDMLASLSEQLTRHHDHGVRDVRGLFMEGLALEAADIAEEDPDRALRLLRQAEEVKVGPQRLGDDARASRDLADLRRGLEEEAETRQAREFAQADRARSQLSSLAQGRVNARMLEALDSGESLLGAERRVLAEIRQDPEMRKIAADLTPAQLQAALGDVSATALRTRRALESDVTQSSPATLNQIDVMRAQGLDTQAILKFSEEAMASGEITGQDFMRLQAQLDGATQAAQVTNASPAFQRAQRRFAPQTISDSLGEGSRKGLLTEQQELQSWVDESVRGIVEGTPNPADRQRALNEFLSGEAFQSRVTAFEAKVAQAGQASDGAVAEITGLIDGNDFEAAEAAIAQAERDQVLSGTQADGLRSRQRQVRSELGRQVNNSDALRNAREAAVEEAIRFAREANPTITEEDERAIAADARAQFQAGAAAGIRDAIRGVPPEQQEVALAQLGDDLRTDLVAGFQTARQRPVEGEEPLVTSETLEALGRRRTARVAQEGLDQAALAGTARNYAQYVPDDLVRGVPTEAYQLRDGLDANQFQSNVFFVGQRDRAEQRRIMQNRMLGAAAQATRPQDFAKAYTQLRGTDRVSAAELQRGAFRLNSALDGPTARALGIPAYARRTTDDPIIGPGQTPASRERFKAVQADVRRRTGLELNWRPLEPGSKYGRYFVKGEVPIEDAQLNPGMAEIEGWGSLSRPKKVELLGRFGFETGTPEQTSEALSLVDEFQSAAARRNAL